MSLILGGAIGNGVDRAVLGEVVDFLDFYIGTYHWPAFNVADIAISVGAGLLVILTDAMGDIESLGRSLAQFRASKHQVIFFHGASIPAISPSCFTISYIWNSFIAAGQEIIRARKNTTRGFQAKHL